MRMKAIGLIAALALGILAAPLASEGQQPAKVARIGFLGSSNPATAAPLLEAFRQGLRELGYVGEGSIVIEARYAERKLDRLPDLAAELGRLKVDVILVGPPPSAMAAKNATRTIPIVFTSVSDPVAIGLVASIARPGGNVTGLASTPQDLGGKRLELLKEVIPGASRVAVFWNPEDPAHGPALNAMQTAAPALGMKLQALEVRGPDDVEGAFRGATQGRARALMVLEGPIALSDRWRIARLAAKGRLPSMHGQREYVGAGGLMAYGANLAANYRRAATYVDKILKGAKPADLPVEQPMRFELVINMKTAKALGLTFPPSILIRATEVIQ